MTPNYSNNGSLYKNQKSSYQDQQCYIIYFIGLKTKTSSFPGSGLFDFITFRVLLAMLLSLIITMVYGKRLISILRKKLGR